MIKGIILILSSIMLIFIIIVIKDKMSISEQHKVKSGFKQTNFLNTNELLNVFLLNHKEIKINHSNNLKNEKLIERKTNMLVEDTYVSNITFLIKFHQSQKEVFLKSNLTENSQESNRTIVEKEYIYSEDGKSVYEIVKTK